MAFSWKTDTATSNSGSLLCSDSSTKGKTGMYGLVNNTNTLVELVNNSSSSIWTAQGVSKPSLSTTSIAFCSGEKASLNDFTSLRTQVANIRNAVGTDTKIYCAVAQAANFSSVENSKNTDYHGTKYDCPTHNATYKSGHDNSK